jgi:hypothetical protein
MRREEGALLSPRHVFHLGNWVSWGGECSVRSLDGMVFLVVVGLVGQFLFVIAQAHTGETG